MNPDANGNYWFETPIQPDPVYYWADFQPNGTYKMRPVRFIDGRMIFQDEPTRNA